MNKTSKKLITLILLIVAAISLFALPAQAARVGDVVGKAQPTDIVATINGYQLESYNVNGLTYICVEDLRYYGFDVYFDMYSKTLSLTRGYDYTTIDPQRTNPDFYTIGTSKSWKNILYTDIATYVNNEYVASSNINGKTIINFNELSRFGTVLYDNDRREISLAIDNANYNSIASVADRLQSNISYNSDWKILFRAKGDILVVIGTSRHYFNSKVNNNFWSEIVPSDKADFKEVLDILKSQGEAISSIYVEYKNTDGTTITSFQVY
ncbi:MAG: hypothetical protein IKA17_03410 [Clostridia bacterium]|nr:hypothetical protein [Clostridia bacterium]